MWRLIFRSFIYALLYLCDECWINSSGSKQWSFNQIFIFWKWTKSQRSKAGKQTHGEYKLCWCGQKTPVFSKHEIARWQVLVQRHQFRAFPQSFLHQMVRDITAKLWAGGLRVGNEFLVQSKTANASSLAHRLTSCLCSSAEDRSVVSGEPALMTLLIKFESVWNRVDVCSLC